MPKWKRQDETVCMPNTVCCAMASDGEEARLIVAAHNADIDALTTERDELQRRMDAVVNWAMSYVEDDCYCTHDNEPVCEVCENTAAIIAIAEGREG